MILARIEQEEPSETWTRFRVLVEGTTRLTDLRVIYREIRSILGDMLPEPRAQLERDLEQRFGPDAADLRDRRLVAAVQKRGRIRSEREYRIVQAFLDSHSGDNAEVLALGALLDEFMAAPQ